MAKGRLTQKGWLLEGGSITLTYAAAGPVWANDVIVAHTDISDSNLDIQREKSDWYFKRIICEFACQYSPGGTGNPLGVPMGVRLGTVPDDVSLQTTIANAWQSLDFNEWTHILRDESYMVYESAALVKDGGAVATDDAFTADGQTFPVPTQLHKWDLSVNLGLMEDHSLLIAIGPWAGGPWAVADGDQFQFDYRIKALLQKRRT